MTGPMAPNVERSILRAAVEFEELSADPELCDCEDPNLIGFGHGNPKGVCDTNRLNHKAILCSSVGVLTIPHLQKRETELSLLALNSQHTSPKERVPSRRQRRRFYSPVFKIQGG